jgi:hypothetical protein
VSESQVEILMDITDTVSKAFLDIAEAFANAAASITQAFWFPDPDNPHHREALVWLQRQEFEHRYNKQKARRARKRKHRRP